MFLYSLFLLIIICFPHMDIFYALLVASNIIRRLIFKLNETSSPTVNETTSSPTVNETCSPTENKTSIPTVVKFYVILFLLNDPLIFT